MGYWGMPYLFLLSISLLLCTRARAQTYDLDAPELLIALPDKLAEISGLGYRDGKLVAVEDEGGNFYYIDPQTGEVSQAHPFWKDGDYEGIETVGEDIWVLKSTGTLYQIRGAGSQVQNVQKYNTWLTGENDAEGLAYDATNHRLLIACKDDARDDGRDKHNRYVFAFDLGTRTLAEEEVYTIPTDENDDFAPSAVAVQPATGQLYLTSSVNNLLMILRPDGSVESVHKFSKDELPQPEGLVFTPDGTLYISTEAKGDRPARIYRLPLRP